MTVLTEGTRNLEYLVSEANQTRSRDSIVLAQSPDEYISGTVLQERAGNPGIYERYDGTGTVLGILYRHANATTAPARAVISARDIEYRLPKLLFLTTVTQEQKDAAIASMKLIGMIHREAT